MKRFTLIAAVVVGCMMLMAVQTSVGGILYYGQPESTVGPTVHVDMEYGAHTVFTVSDGLTYYETFVGHMVEFRSGTNVAPGCAYNVSLSTNVLGSGGYVFRSLSPEAAWLYSQYAAGTLDGFPYSSDDLDVTQRIAESQLRFAIGYLQGLWTLWEVRLDITEVGLGWISKPKVSKPKLRKHEVRLLSQKRG